MILQLYFVEIVGILTSVHAKILMSVIREQFHVDLIQIVKILMAVIGVHVLQDMKVNHREEKPKRENQKFLETRLFN